MGAGQVLGAEERVGEQDAHKQLQVLSHSALTPILTQLKAILTQLTPILTQLTPILTQPPSCCCRLHEDPFFSYLDMHTTMHFAGGFLHREYTTLNL